MYSPNKLANTTLLLLSGLLFLCGHLIGEEQPESINNGEDVTRPITRFDTRFKYQAGDNLPESKGVILTARSDQSIKFNTGWRIGLRVDFPYIWYYSPLQGSQQKSITHMDDSLFQALLITPTYANFSYGFGMRTVFPTAGDNTQIGDGKYQLQPTVAFKYNLDDWSPGAYIGMINRYAFDVAGYKSANYISKLFLQPFFNVNLAADWFLNSSPEIIYNFRTEKWFVPFDIMLGKMITPKLVVSIEYENAIVYDYPQFTQEVEFRIGFFF